MKYVYILRPQAFPGKYYIGITNNIRGRLAKHNAKEVRHTSKFAPWEIKSYVAFADEASAVAFERYLKTASGRPFAKNGFNERTGARSVSVASKQKPAGRSPGGFR